MHWCGHVMRREEDNIGRRILGFQVEAKRPRENFKDEKAEQTNPLIYCGRSEGERYKKYKVMETTD